MHTPTLVPTAKLPAPEQPEAYVRKVERILETQKLAEQLRRIERNRLFREYLEGK